MVGKMKTAGVIYILTNPSFPEYVKIGYADDLKARLNILNQNECIPFAFRAYAVYEVYKRVEDITLHKMIDRINPALRAIETFDGKKRKKEFYAMTPEDAYAILEAIATISGTSDNLHRLTPEGHEITDEILADELSRKVVYTEEAFFENSSKKIKELYYKLRERIIEFGDVSVEAKKLYIAFKAPKNFVDIEVQKKALKLYINMSTGTLDDPHGITTDISNVGHWGNGDYIISLKDESMIDQAIEIIKESYLTNKK